MMEESLLGDFIDYLKVLGEAMLFAVGILLQSVIAFALTGATLAGVYTFLPFWLALAATPVILLAALFFMFVAGSLLSRFI
jgi:hypothetical protein